MRFLTFRRVGMAVVVLAFVLALAACGKKPGGVDPPVGAETQKFPHIYPDPATDPEP